MTSSPSRRGRPTYRHGQVRAEALEAALAILAENGAKGLNIRAIAGRIGVAHRALYNHFDNRDALLDEVAASGFAALARSLAETGTRGALITAYLGFALDRPDLYDIMMARPRPRMDASRALGEAVRSVIATVVDRLEPGRDARTARRPVMALWMRLHGGLSLFRGGILALASRQEFIEEMLAIEEDMLRGPG